MMDASVTSWLRAAGLSDDYRSFYYFLQSVALRWFDLGTRVLTLATEQALHDLSRVLLVIDDLPTKRYLRDVFTRLPSLPPDGLDELLPDVWLAAHPQHRWQIDDLRREVRVQNRR